MAFMMSDRPIQTRFPLQSTCLLTLPLLLIVSACSTSKPAPISHKAGPTVVHQEHKRFARTRKTLSRAEKGTVNTLSQTRQGLPHAVTSPLTDLNLKRPVPPDTLEKLGYVYTANHQLSCKEIARQIAVLDSALQEPDTDVVIAKEIVKQHSSASETTLDVIRGIARSFIPLRPVVRTVTGARKAKKHYDERYDNGRRRRAFLKGYGLAKGCKTPAAPLITYAPYWGRIKPVDPKAPNKRWNESQVPPAGK